MTQGAAAIPFLLFLLLSACVAAGDAESGEDARDVAGDAGTAAGGLAARGPGAGFVVQAGEPHPDVPEEPRLRNVRQLTFDGENAEAYFSFDGTRLVYQRSEATGGCDQIHTLDLASGEQALVSTGQGRTTCAYFLPEAAEGGVLYSSTHLESPECPAPPDYSRGYVWPLHPGYDIFVTDGSGEPRRLTSAPGYDAEATVSPVGDRIVFTSVRDGDLELYSMAPDGSDVTRLTHREGYDGGAFFSPDGSKIVWRAHYPETEEALEEYRDLLAQGLIRPTALEIYVADADGSNVRQVTDNGAANFAPYWHPSGDRILFSSNMDDPAGRDFDIYMVDLDGTGLERVTVTPDFDGFPVFSPDGRFLVWGSNRNMSHDGNTNLFIAEWREVP